MENTKRFGLGFGRRIGHLRFGFSFVALSEPGGCKKSSKKSEGSQVGQEVSVGRGEGSVFARALNDPKPHRRPLGQAHVLSPQPAMEGGGTKKKELLAAEARVSRQEERVERAIEQERRTKEALGRRKAELLGVQKQEEGSRQAAD
eukprot:10852468-Heterocapsa_arctica.AAC.1